MSHSGINVFTFYKQFYPKKMGEYKNHLSLDHEINKYNDSLNDLFDKSTGHYNTSEKCYKKLIMFKEAK